MKKQYGLNNLFGKASFQFYMVDTGFLVLENVEDDSPDLIRDMPNVMKSLRARGINLSHWKILFKSDLGYDGVFPDEDGENAALFALDLGLTKELVIPQTFKAACQLYDPVIAILGLNETA